MGKRTREGGSRPGIIAIATLAVIQSVMAVAKAEPERAPDVVVLCDLSLRAALVAAGEAWRTRSGVPVRVFTATTEQNAQLVVRGARADILAGIGAKRIDEAQGVGALARAAPVVIGHDPIVLAVRGNALPSRRLNPGDDLDGLLGGGRFGVVDTAFGGAGADARNSLAAVGLWPSLESRGMGAETSEGLKQLLGDGSVRVAAFYRTDLAGEPGLSVVATFPTPAATVTAALAKNQQSPYAKDFLAYLAGDGQSVLRQNGMEPP